MGMVGGLDLHRGQITFDVVATETEGEVWRGRIWQPDRERFIVAAARRAGRAGRRRAGRVLGGGGVHGLAVCGGGDHCGGFRRWRTWPSRPKRKRPGAGNAGPRPIAPTPSCYGSCSSPASCPSRGSRPSACSSGGNGCGSTRASSISEPSGPSASTPSCSNMGWRCPTARSAPRRPAHRSPTRPWPSARRPAGVSRPATP